VFAEEVGSGRIVLPELPPFSEELGEAGGRPEAEEAAEGDGVLSSLEAAASANRQ
jgi:hypothetical protein